MKKLILFVATIVLVLIALGLSVWFATSGPVLVDWHYGISFGAICDPPLVILNPFRKRDAEHGADEFLRELQKGNVQVLEGVVSDAERREHFQLSEKAASIRSWYAGDRNETDSESDITYWVERNYDHGCFTMPTNVGLTRTDGGWKVTSYNPSY